MEPRSSRRQRNAPTINDVAKHAGVSPMTVSRVINGEQIVRSATKEKVEAAIAALNYSPSAAARSLAGGDETRIGRSEEPTSELQSLMRISYDAFRSQHKTHISHLYHISTHSP